MGWRGLQKNPEYAVKSELKDEVLNCPNLKELAHDFTQYNVVLEIFIFAFG